jgi:hypothetical protein
MIRLGLNLKEQAEGFIARAKLEIENLYSFPFTGASISKLLSF